VTCRESYEQLLLKYKVDLVFSGHTHAYERTKPIANYQVRITTNSHELPAAKCFLCQAQSAPRPSPSTRCAQSHLTLEDCKLQGLSCLVALV
jgi:hypothetical protein